MQRKKERERERKTFGTVGFGRRHSSIVRRRLQQFEFQRDEEAAVLGFRVFRVRVRVS
jgi:hypothetical protein